MSLFVGRVSSNVDEKGFRGVVSNNSTGSTRSVTPSGSVTEEMDEERTRLLRTSSFYTRRVFLFDSTLRLSCLEVEKTLNT